VKTNEEIQYQISILRELFQIDVPTAFDLALVKIECLELCFLNAMFLYNQVMNDNKRFKSILDEIQNHCNQDLSVNSTSNSQQIISIISRKNS